MMMILITILFVVAHGFLFDSNFGVKFDDFRKNIKKADLHQKFRYQSILFSSSTNTEVESTNERSAKLPLPFMNVESIGLTGRWTEQAGNYILKPHLNESGSTLIKPYGVIHFLGGAFVGAAPHLTYRYLLESLCEQGYLIVATPYRLEMDYIRSCDQILSKFDAVAVDLARGNYQIGSILFLIE